MSRSPRHSLSWSRLFTTTILVSFIYIFMEWLFFVTKPSFMDPLSAEKKAELLMLTALVIVIMVLPILLVLRILGLLPGPSMKWQVFQSIGAVIPAFIAAALSLLLIDNFTYTLFKVGIVTSQGFWRGAYALLMVVLLVLWYIQVLRILRVKVQTETISDNKRPSPRIWKRLGRVLLAALILVPVAFLGIRQYTAGPSKDQSNGILKSQPNIILLGGDGVVASHMSLYGYARNTTPNLDELAKTGLLAENNFTNAAHTTGSVTSMLTGKYPADTRLLYSPNILQGEDATEHLPGILQRAGYRTVEITFPYYIDAYDLNMQEGFDEVNGRSLDQGKLFKLARRYHLEDVGYFLPRIYQRISDRLLHIFFVRVMSNPFTQVLQPANPDTIQQLSDEARIRQLIYLLSTSDKPVFVHVHLMDTHGGMFYPRKQVYSAGRVQVTEWLMNFYDDAILDYDAYVGELLTSMDQLGLMDNSILVMYSDHPDQWRTNDKIPLLFHFPNGEYAGRIHNNTQNLDVAPTILDYLGMNIPTWMSGQSLLRGEPPATRPIISAGVVGVDCDRPGWWCIIDPSLVWPPFNQFGYMQVVICQKMYEFDLNSHQLTETDVFGHTAPCNADKIPTHDQVKQIIIDHLRLYGFDVSSLLK
jgi:hypothetical protein